MQQEVNKILEYDKVIESVQGFAISEMGKEKIGKLAPSFDMGVVQEWLSETTEACNIIQRSSHVPLPAMTGVSKVFARLGKGGVLQPEDLGIMQALLEGAARMKRFMQTREEIAPKVSTYAYSMADMEEVVQELHRCIIEGRVADKASADLGKIRKKIAILEERIAQKLDGILKSSTYRDYIQDAVISLRNGRYVIPVKKEYRRNIEGSVLDTSATGSTVFIEPAAVRKLQEELNLARLEEEKEIYNILYYLTGLLEGYQREVGIIIETLAHYDFVFAKARYSRSIGGTAVAVNNCNRIRIRDGRHPLIGRNAVPLDVSLGEHYRTLVITGPNTGGKTVALKTVGLLTMMVKSGLHIPAAPDSDIALFAEVLADIGDGQSIEQSLSTFSSHIRNIIGIMAKASPHTLILMDELGTGTDPSEGMGLAISVLEHIHGRGAVTLATTHYSEIKEFAENTEGFENGCMEFDIHTLRPLYRLRVGKAGESNAFLIALRLGMDPHIITRAHEITYKEIKVYSSYREEQETGSLSPAPSAAQVPAHVVRQVPAAAAKADIPKQQYAVGDCVYIHSMRRTGIVCEPENNRGEVTVMVMKNRIKVNRKRLTLYVGGEELYPDDYDMDIVLESKENRKKRKQMSKRHVPGITVESAAESTGTIK